MITIEDCVKDFKTESFEIKPEKVIENLFLSWLYNEKTGELKGMDRGNKAHEALIVMKFLKKFRKADLDNALALTKERISEQKPFETSEIIEELFIGWLGTNTSNIGGEYDVKTYRVFNKIKFFFRQLSVAEYILKEQKNG